jgi:predicted RNA binding protein YcfA (HicA-like mRNA interferase family)
LSLRNHTTAEVVKILTKYFGFYVDRQRKHILLKHPNGRSATIPNHPNTPIKLGTLRSILSQANITEEEFIKYL